MSLEVLPCENEWPYKDIEKDWNGHRNCWRIVDEEFFDYCLGCLPPLDWNNGKFLVSEPYTSYGDDEIYCCLANYGLGNHCARYVPRMQANKLVNELREHLAKKHNGDAMPNVEERSNHVSRNA